MTLPDYSINVFSTDDELPAEAEEMFHRELESSRSNVSDVGPWCFFNICAMTASGHVLGGLHMDTGPFAFGPLAQRRLAILEHLLVRPRYRNHGVATALLERAAEVATMNGCDHIQFNVSWANRAEIAVCRKAGFAMTCIEDGYYFVMQPTQAVSCV